MAKKWYDLFVVSNAKAGVAAPDSSAGASVDAGAPPEFEGDASEVADAEAIYAAAKIVTPAHGYTVLKVAAMLESEHIRELPADVRRKSVMVALDAAQVPVNEIVEDAIRRDRALDTYERILEQNLASLQTTTLEENRRLEAEAQQRIGELRARIEHNNQTLGQARVQLAAWCERKRAEESRIAAAVGYFVPDNPISHAAGGQGVTEDVR